MWRSRGRREVRGWHFWRKAFWTRAAFFVVYAVLAVVASGGAAYGAVDTWREVQVIRGHHMCGPGVEGRCLVARQGQIVPTPRLGYGQRRWTVLFEQRGHIVDSIDVTPHDYALLLAADPRVSALMIGDRVVAVDLPGREVRASTDDVRGVWFFVLLSLTLLGIAFGLVRYALKKRVAVGGWWDVAGPPPDARDLVAFVVPVVPCVLAVAVVAGVSWRWLLVIAVPAAAYAVWSLLRDRPREPREPDLPGLIRRR